MARYHAVRLDRLDLRGGDVDDHVFPARPAVGDQPCEVFLQLFEPRGRRYIEGDNRMLVENPRRWQAVGGLIAFQRLLEVIVEGLGGAPLLQIARQQQARAQQLDGGIDHPRLQDDLRQRRPAAGGDDLRIPPDRGLHRRNIGRAERRIALGRSGFPLLDEGRLARMVARMAVGGIGRSRKSRPAGVLGLRPRRGEAGQGHCQHPRHGRVSAHLPPHRIRWAPWGMHIATRNKKA